MASILLGLMAGLTAAGGVASAVGRMQQSQMLAQQQMLEQRRLLLAARSEEVAAEQKAAERMRKVTELMGANLARMGGLGLEGGSLFDLGREAQVRAGRDISIERDNAALTATMRRLEASTRNPKSTMRQGYIGAAGSLLSAGAKAAGAYAQKGS